MAGSPAPPAETLTCLMKHSRDGLEQLAEVLEQCWSLILEPHWSHIRALYETDIMPRASKLALGDTASLLNDLHPVTRFCEGTLELHRPSSPGPGWLGPPAEVTLAGRGLLLVPEVFAWPKVSVILDDYWQPSLYYSPRGVANLWGGQTVPPCKRLAFALGGQRAQVLLAVSRRSTTQDIAKELEVTTGNVSHHLARLRRAGLVEVRREGRLLFYSLSTKGEALLELFT
jgi:DNA-binding transcriptional ArsR family regulator